MKTKTNGVTNKNDSRLKIIESDDDQLIIELCGIQITGSLWSGERAVIGVQMSKAFDEYIYIEHSKNVIEWIKGNDEMCLTFKSTNQALRVAAAVNTIRAYCEKR